VDILFLPLILERDGFAFAKFLPLLISAEIDDCHFAVILLSN
jgi:hypothetical protein